MNPIHHALLSSSFNYALLYDVGLKLVAEIDTEKSGFYFFRAYLTANFPTVVCDKKYFFLYSTHHEIGDGGIYWGKASNLELTDFVEGGLIKSGYQAETPSLIEIEGKLFLYYHTDGYDPANGNKQLTHLMTSDGGAELHLMTWQEESTPIPLLDGQDHSGYAKEPYVRGTEFVLTHITKSGLPQPWVRSVSTDGYTYTQEASIDTTTGIESGYFFKPSEGTYFDYNGEQWWIGTIQPTTSSFGADKKMILAKSNELYGAVTQRAVIFNENIFNVMSAHIEGDTSHIYFIKQKSALWYGKLDLTQLKL